jgi:hypothetical protein
VQLVGSADPLGAHHGVAAQHTHPHAQRGGEARQVGTDRPRAEDGQPAAVQLAHSTGEGNHPEAVPLGALLEPLRGVEVARQHQHLTEDVLGNTHRVQTRRVGQDHIARHQRREEAVLDPGRGRVQPAQAARRGEMLWRHPPTDEYLGLGQRRRQLLGSFDRDDLELRKSLPPARQRPIRRRPADLFQMEECDQFHGGCISRCPTTLPAPWVVRHPLPVVRW